MKRPTAERLRQIRDALEGEDIRGVLADLLGEVDGLAEENMALRGRVAELLEDRTDERVRRETVVP